MKMKKTMAWAVAYLAVLSGAFVASPALANSDYCSPLAGTINVPGSADPYHPVWTSGTTVGGPTGVVPAAASGFTLASLPGCAVGDPAAIGNEPAAVYEINIPEPGTYSFHVSSDFCTPEGACTPRTWETYIFLLSNCADPTTATICNNNGYGTNAGVSETRSDLTAYLNTGTYYLAVTGVGAGSAGPFTLWILNDNYGFARYPLNHTANRGEIDSTDSLDALFVSLQIMTANAEIDGLFDVAPAQTLTSVIYNTDGTVKTPAVIYPVGDGVVNNLDSLSVLFLSFSAPGMMVIPTGPVGASQAACYLPDCDRSTWGCWTGSAWHTDQATTNTTNDADNSACGANGATCLNCRAANKYCYNYMCEVCDGNTCPHGCCDASGVCHLINNSTYNGNQTNSVCGYGGASCATCPTYSFNGGDTQNQPVGTQQIQCVNGVCADCTVTFALTAAENFCAATFEVAYPNVGTSAVSYAGMTNGAVDANFSDFISPATFSASTSSLEFQVETNDAPSGTTGSGSFAVLHFTGTTGTPPVIGSAALSLTSGTVDGFTVSIPPGDVWPFVDCSIPPNAESLAGDYTVTLSCPDYSNDH